MVTPAPWAGPVATLQLQHGTGSCVKNPWAVPLSAESDVEGFHALHCQMSSRQLKAVYSMSWYEGLLVAAGKQGWCSLYSIPQVCISDSLVPPFSSQQRPCPMCLLRSSS